MRRRRRYTNGAKDSTGRIIIEFWRSVLLTVLAFAVMVAGIFMTSSMSWRKKQSRLEIEVKKQEEEKPDYSRLVQVYTWGHDFDIYRDGEQRVLTRMEPGEEYRIGALLKYDRGWEDRKINGGDRDYDKLKHIYGFNPYRIDTDDDAYYADPIFTFTGKCFLRIRFSIDSVDGRFICAETERGLKTGNLRFIPSSEALDTPHNECFGKSPLSVRFSANGMGGTRVDTTNGDVSDSMRQYNTITEERLGDAYANVPEKYADRKREIFTCRLFVDVYEDDPRLSITRSGGTVFSLSVIIRRYSEWNLTKAEYDEIMPDVPEITGMEYSPKLTAELVW